MGTGLENRLTAPLHFVRLYHPYISFDLVKLILGFVVSPCLGPWKQFMVTIDDV